MTEEEAKKMVKALDKQLKATEKAAQKAAKGTTRAMKQIDNSAKRSAMSARSLRKEFANIDRLTSEASQGLALVSPAMGEAAAQASVAASGINYEILDELNQNVANIVLYNYMIFATF